MYIAGFVIPVPEHKKEAYRKWAAYGAELFKEYGCLEIVESWEDNVPDGKRTDFRRAVDAKAGEKIVFTWRCGPTRRAAMPPKQRCARTSVSRFRGTFRSTPSA
jgi:uncharacterized protein YbaA (DUF1428 family)